MKFLFAGVCLSLLVFIILANRTYMHISAFAKSSVWPDSQSNLFGKTTAIVLGMGPTPTQAIVDRSELAATLWQAGFVEHFIVSGGQGHDEVESEARTIANDLVTRGVPASIIEEEDQSTSTFENLTFSKTLLAARHHNPAKPIIVVTHDFHAARVSSIAESLGMGAIIVSSDGPRLNNRTQRGVREILAFWKWKIVGR